jgi:hypothetical protein
VSAATVAGARTGPLLRLLVTVALCAWLWTWLARHADLGELAAQVARLPAWTWCAAAVGLVGAHVLRALRLQREWRHVRPVGLLPCLRILLLHNALVLVMPLRSGEVGFLWGVQRQWGVGWKSAGLALLRWRLQDAIVLALLAVLLLLPATLPSRLLLAGAAALAAAAVLPRVWAWLLARSGVHAHAVQAPWWGGFGASAGNWVCKLVANGGLLAALAGIPLASALRGALGGEIAGVQPLQPPAGLGVYEGGVWLATALPTTWQAQVVSAALAVHAFSLAIALGAAALSRLPLASLRGAGNTPP